MTSAWTLVSLLFVGTAPRETLFIQVAPAKRTLAEATRTAGRDRAVVLLHGFRLHPFQKEKIGQAELHEWQRPESLLVKRLAHDSDVFAFAYGFEGAADDVSTVPLLDVGVRMLRSMGYRSIVLVGHSAGGLVARDYVEDNPSSGVTKVIQVCSPNVGSPWAAWHLAPPKQASFLESLSKPTRRLVVAGRSDRRIPEQVEFACIVANGLLIGDGMVGTSSQWPEDLRLQGVPAYALSTTHWQTVRARIGVDLIAELIRNPLPRWDKERIAAARRSILGEPAPKTR